MHWKVCWRTPTGRVECSKAMELKLANAWLADSKAKHPDMEWWLESERATSSIPAFMRWLRRGVQAVAFWIFFRSGVTLGPASPYVLGVALWRWPKRVKP